MFIENYTKINTIACDNETAKRIFNDLKILPINEYYSKTLGKDVSIFIKAKKIVDYLKENNLEVLNG